MLEMDEALYKAVRECLPELEDGAYMRKLAGAFGIAK
jgi:hypothetical protein